MRAALYAGTGAVAALTASAAAWAYAVTAPSSQVFAPSVYRGPGRRRSIALTFDDGPSPGTTELLEILDRHRVRATFFQCGASAERHPGLARAVADAGHEIANHTWSHPRLPPRLGWQLNLRSRQEIFREFERTQTFLRDVTGQTPRLLRAPYGMRWFGLRETQRRLGLLGVMWTVIGHDWEWPAADIADLVLRCAAPGGIICLHDGRDVRVNPDIHETLSAVRRIVPVLLDAGYAFETASDLLRDDAIAGVLV